MSNLNDLFDALGAGDEDSAQQHFNSVMGDKIQAALDARKIEIAGSIYNGQTETEVEETDELQATETETE